MMAAANQPLTFGKEVVTGKCGLDNNGNRNVEHEPIYVSIFVICWWLLGFGRFVDLRPDS